VSDRGCFCTSFINDPAMREAVCDVLAMAEGVTVYTLRHAPIVAGMVKGLGRGDDEEALRAACEALCKVITEPIVFAVMPEYLDGKALLWTVTPDGVTGLDMFG